MRRRLFSLVALIISLPAGAAPGVAYEAVRNGVTTRIELRVDGSRFQGTLSEQALQLPLRGELAGPRLQGQVFEPRSGQALMAISAEVHGDELRLELLLPGAAPMRLDLSRVGTVAAAAQATATPVSKTAVAAAVGPIDPLVVGRWRHESQINSPGGAGGFASFSTVRTLELTADGRVRQSVRSVGGGGNWSSDSGGRTEFSGRWRVSQGVMWVQPDGQTDFIQAGRYRLAGAYLVTENAKGRRIWSR